jgi:hypothetical protein
VKSFTSHRRGFYRPTIGGNKKGPGNSQGATLYPSGDQIVGANTAATLSNKTLTSPSVSGNMSVSGNVQAASFNGQSLPITIPPMAQIRTGQVNLGVISGGQGNQVAVGFSSGMSGTPIVVVSQFMNPGDQSFVWCQAENVTASGFTAHAQNQGSGGSTNVTVSYIAVYGAQ